MIRLTGLYLATELGYVEIEWTEAGEILADTLDADDIMIPGVDVDRAEPVGNGKVRYWYNDDQESLTDGVIDLVVVAGQVE